MGIALGLGAALSWGLADYFAAVASRSHEIAVLLTLGFHPRSVLASFLAESALIAIVSSVPRFRA